MDIGWYTVHEETIQNRLPGKEEEGWE